MEKKLANTWKNNQNLAKTDNNQTENTTNR